MRSPRARCVGALLALTTTLLVSACGGGSATDFCAVAVPIYVSKDDALTVETVRQIVVHNETWEAICHAHP